MEKRLLMSGVFMFFLEFECLIRNAAGHLGEGSMREKVKAF
ncbi:hypothetical protein KIS4809_0662 [Bacillus sp. ZZV12-4809]|nr:hypothetical protein KIS4809_0662 [Bacillus sp. ZZV12-4809]